MLTETCKHLRCEHFISDTGGDRCNALLCPYEDKPVYEEAMDSIASLKAALAEKEKVIKVFQDDAVMRKAHIEHLEKQIAALKAENEGLRELIDGATEAVECFGDSDSDAQMYWRETWLKKAKQALTEAGNVNNDL